MNSFKITPADITLDDIQNLLDDYSVLQLSNESKNLIKESREFLDQKLASSDEALYGINTGFGSLYNQRINNKDLHRLQNNLVMSHACGVGDKMPDEIVQLMLLLKAHSLSKGYSSVQVETVMQLIHFYNNKIYPVVYKWGSLGASGDLAPLAHLALALIGKGEVSKNGKISDSLSVLESHKLQPVNLIAKEGLALINGTQFISAIAVHILLKIRQLISAAHFISSVSLDAFDCSLSPFDADLHKIRPHKGQGMSASIIRRWLEDSEIANAEKEHLQDPYSFRCIPQVIGASLAAFNHVEDIVTIEINSVTDNPTVFSKENKIISGGNFHAQPMAIALDYLGIALAEVGNISERRTYQLISGQRGLPAFLINEPGINSGLMIPQYTAAALVSRNKLLCGSASSDSIVSSNGQEDHVSMGAHAAIKCLEILENVYQILGIELLTSSQALQFRKGKKTSPQIQKLIDSYRGLVPVVEEDRPLYLDIRKSVDFIKSNQFSY